ncbi:MAG: hypothetical protein LBJ23_07970 [Tannerella sp.]|jgi:hypothetical protein|nr:hypothetical protein [Tannerella sp.]
MTEKNRFGRLLCILIIAWTTCAALYRLPDEVLGLPVKKVDLLSDIRIRPEDPRMDSLLFTPLETIPSVPDSAYLHHADSILLVKRDSLYHALLAEMETDTAHLRIRDFSPGHTGLRRFFTSLNHIETLNRPVRIAFLGDSFIEGDIIVADFRAMMQTHFGGHGVGFVPVTSNVAQYRPTIRQQSAGWKTHSILSDRQYEKYALSGLSFDTEDGEASISFRTTDNYPGLEEASSLKFIYSGNSHAEVRLICNGAKDTIRDVLPSTDSIRQYEMQGHFTDGRLRFRNAEDLQALGIALEDPAGVVVDNFSLRSNTGIVWANLHENTCRAWNEIRPYDLIIIQYGLNVTSGDQYDYKWYAENMKKAVKRLRTCFPESDMLLLGVSDRSHYHNGAYKTMPSVVALWNAQYKIAEQTGIPFWSIFHAMGGENSMVRYVKNRWAGKDYTHLSFRGGRQIAAALFDTLMLEKKLYDEVEKILD